MEAIKEYINPELLVLIPVLYLIGVGIKKTEKIDNRHIPLLLGLISILLCGGWIACTADFTGWRGIVTAIFTAVVQGELTAGASVYCNQLVKQNKQTMPSDTENEGKGQS